VSDSLPRSKAVVDTNVIGVGFVVRFNIDLGLIKQLQQCLAFILGRFKKRTDMALGYDQGMTFRYWEAITDDEGMLIFRDDCAVTLGILKTTKWTKITQLLLAERVSACCIVSSHPTRSYSKKTLS
jgi:hypothetical protein